MEEKSKNKRRRIQSFKPNDVLRVSFSSKYMNYLFSGLRELSINGNCMKENQEKKKTVRYQIDMALVLSSSQFAWSQALKLKLEGEMEIQKIQIRVPDSLNHDHKSPLSFSPNLHPPTKSCLNNSERKRKKIIKRRGENEELCLDLKTLRKLLPGGDDMEMDELFTEVESYIICLEMQVNILRSLVCNH